MSRGRPVDGTLASGDVWRVRADSPSFVLVLRGVGTVLPAAAVVLTALLAFRRLDDTDMWWHLAAGRWIVEHHAIPRTDTLSYMLHDAPWINLQWLFDLSVYSLYRTGGPTLLVLASTLLYAGATALLLKSLRLALGPIAACLMTLWGVAIAQGRFVIRPEMASFLFLEIVLFVCATGSRTGGRRLWLLPPVLAFWANTHGLFVIGAFVIGC